METVDQSVRSRFSAAARSYESGARIQKRVADTLLARMPPQPWPTPILEIACGSGQFTERLLAHAERSRVHAIDIAEGMVDRTRARLGHDPRLSLAVRDFRAYESPHRYGLIVSNCALHWLTPLQTALERTARLLEPGGLLVGSLMVEGTLAELHEARLRVAPSKPPAGRLPDPDQVIGGLTGAGFHVQDSTEEILTASYASGPAFLAALHAQGVTGGAVSRAAVPLNRTEIRRLTDVYEARYRQADGTVRASYRVLYVTATVRAEGR